MVGTERERSEVMDVPGEDAAGEAGQVVAVEVELAQV